MKLRALKAGVSRLSSPFVAVAAVAVLIGCGDAGERVTELPAGSGDRSGAVLHAAGDAAGGDADIYNVAVDGIGGGDVRDDAVEAGDDGVDDDAAGDAGVGVGDAVYGGDEGGTGGGGAAVDDGAGVGGDGDGDGDGGVDVVGEDAVDVGVVDDGGGGLLVVGVCGWPGLLCPADESVAPIDEGGSLWMGPTWGSKAQWEPWVGRVLDLCNPHEALAAIDGRYWANRGGGIDYGAEIEWPDMQRVLLHREYEAVACTAFEALLPVWECRDDNYSELQGYLAQFVVQPSPPEVLAWAESKGFDCYDAKTLGRRYVVVTVGGPSNPKVSVEAAVDVYRQGIEFVASLPGDFAYGERLGYWGRSYVVDSPQNGLVVLSPTVSVIDGVVRGLAQNHSERLWARNVVVTATDTAGTEGVWRFPLAVQPGEPLPFEIEGWTGAQSPSEIALAVSAEMSPRIDLSRSLDLTWFTYYRYTVEELSEWFPEAMIGSEIPDVDVHFVEVKIGLAAPTAQARLAQAALDQTIEDLVVYGAILNGGVVSDVFEMTPMTKGFYGGSEKEWIERSSIGTGDVTVGALLKDVDEPLIWAGGVGPSRGEFGGEDVEAG